MSVEHSDRDSDSDIPERISSIGYIGLGHLGGHLARHLLLGGYRVTVCDLDPASVAGLVEAGATAASTAREVAEACDIVFTCLPSPRAISAVVEGPDGLLAGFRPGSVWIDNSTNDRSETLRLAARCAEVGVEMLEAPVTGGVHKAASGEITVLVGGPKALLERCRPLLESIGEPVLYLGELGQAATIKVITNMLAFIHLVAAGEAMMLAERGGIDAAAAFQAVCESSGASFVHATEGQLVLSGSYNINFTMDLACKDLGFATDLGRRFGVPLDLAGLTEQTFIRARSRYGGEAWSTEVVRLLEDALGTEIRADGFPDQLQ